MMRIGVFKPVHVKTLVSQEVRTLLGGRHFLEASMIDIENSIRGLLRNFGLKVVEGNTNLEAVVGPAGPCKRQSDLSRSLAHARPIEKPATGEDRAGLKVTGWEKNA